MSKINFDYESDFEPEDEENEEMSLNEALNTLPIKAETRETSRNFPIQKCAPESRPNDTQTTQQQKSQECQTDEIRIVDQMTQKPVEWAPSAFDNEGKKPRAGPCYEWSNPIYDCNGGSKEEDPEELASFMNKATTLMCVILESQETPSP